jgi:hypothetical protein
MQQVKQVTIFVEIQYLEDILFFCRFARIFAKIFVSLKVFPKKFVRQEQVRIVD